MAVLVLGVLFASTAAYVQLVRSTADPDMFWHLATGRYVVQHRAVPTTDVFSWYGRERHSRWVSQEWLFGVAAWAVYSLGGFRLLYAVTAAFGGALFLLAYALALRRCGKRIPSLLIAAVATLGTLPNVAARPQMVTYCLLLVVALMLEHKLWYWTLPIVLVGVNLHGGVWPLYVLLAAFYALPETPLLVGLTAACAFLTPNGIGTVLYPLAATVSPPRAISEFQPTALAANPVNLVVYLGVVVLAWGQRIKARDAVFALAFTMLSLTAIRHTALFYVLVIPMLAPYLAARYVEGAPPERRRVLGGVLVGALSVCVAVLGFTAATARLDVHRGYPRMAVAYLKGRPGVRLFNVWQDGGYLIFNGVEPLIDGRGDPFTLAASGDDLLGRYWAAWRLSADYRGLFDRYKIEYVLLEKRLPFYRAIAHDSTLAPVLQDGGVALFRYTGTAEAEAAPVAR